MIRAVSYAEILGAPNAKELLGEYAAECSIPEIGEINPQAEMYGQMERSGNFQVFGAFEKMDHPLDPEWVVGFAAILVYLNPHYGKRIATVESLFLSKDHRGTAMGHGLMSALEDYAKERGCEAILYSARSESQLEKLLFCLRPYQRSHSVFLRQLIP